MLTHVLVLAMARDATVDKALGIGVPKSLADRCDIAICVRNPHGNRYHSDYHPVGRRHCELRR